MRTLGGRLTDLKPISGFAAETAAGAALVGSTILGAPVSTTHVVTGAITGVGTVQRRSAVRWPVAGRIASSWILTIPVAGVLGATAYRTTLAFTTFTTGVAASAALAGLAVLMVLSGRGRPKSVANEPRRPTPTAA